MTSNQIMTTNARSPSNCDINRKTCPPGHEMIECLDGQGYDCRQCDTLSYQPNENRLGDQCRLRRVCYGAFEEHASFGTAVTNAVCKCIDGYHFENEDQRACVPNRICTKGYGQGTYGVCEYCLDKQMYSDVEDRIQKCKPLTNCKKDSKCVIKESNGTFDNICGPVVKDTNDCSSVVKDPGTDGTNNNLAIILGITGAVVVLLLLIILLIVCTKRRQQKRRGQKTLTPGQLEEVKLRIIEKCEKDDSLCKKTISTSFHIIENKIDRQIWQLPQELFKKHFQPGRYEVLVAKYKGSQEKYAVNGYLREWHEWKGTTQESVSDLFNSLLQVKREDIIYEICNKLRNDVDVTFDIESNEAIGNNRAKDSFMSEVVDIFFPCLKSSSVNDNVSKTEKAETTDKLLELKSRGSDVDLKDTNCSSGGSGGRNLYTTYPSAPVFTDDNTLVDPQDYKRQYSMPVQCTS